MDFLVNEFLMMFIYNRRKKKRERQIILKDGSDSQHSLDPKYHLTITLLKKSQMSTILSIYALKLIKHHRYILLIGVNFSRLNN